MRKARVRKGARPSVCSNQTGEELMSKTYAVLLHVEEEKLPVIIGALTGSATLKSVDEVAEPKKRRSNTPGYVNGKHNKGISGPDLLLKVMTEKRIYGLAELMKAFGEN